MQHRNLLAHLNLVRDEEWPHLEGLSDDEYLWEPAPRMWSVVPPGQARTRTVGSGDWRLEFPVEEPLPPPPATTIAWRITHMYFQNLMYNQVVFRSGTLTFDDFPVTRFGAVAGRYWLDSVDRFIKGFESLSDGDLTTAVTMPWGEELSIAEWAMSFLFHNTHHSAEIGTLRDLYRELGDRRPGAVGRRPICG